MASINAVTAELLVKHAVIRVDKQHEDIATIEKKAERQRDFLTKLFTGALSIVGALTWLHSAQDWSVNLVGGAVCIPLYVLATRAFESADTVVELARGPKVANLLDRWDKAPEEVNLGIAAGLKVSEIHNDSKINEKAKLLERGMALSRWTQYATLAWIVAAAVTLALGGHFNEQHEYRSTDSTQSRNDDAKCPAAVCYPESGATCTADFACVCSQIGLTP